MIDHTKHLTTILPIITSLLLLLVPTLPAATPKPPPEMRFQFQDDDRIVLIGNTLVERAQRFGYLETALLARLAPLKLTFRNLGWSGDTVFAESRGIFDNPAKGYQRLLQHVARLKPTVLILGYGSNESFDGPKGLPRFLEQYRKLIADLKSRSEPSARVVILTLPPQQLPGLRRLDTTRLFSTKPNRAAEATPRFSRFFIDSTVARNRQINQFNTDLANFARHNRLAVLDLNAPFQRLQSQRPSEDRLLFTVDGRALDATGYQILASAVIDQLYPLGSLTVHLADNQPPRVTGPLAIQRASYRDGQLVLATRPGRFVLRVHGLAKKRYTLKINQQDFGNVSAKELSAGISPSVSNPPDGLAKLREAVIAKNRLYFHRWRPQNTTYLFGFRKHEQGNNAKEIAQFEKLVAENETEINRLKHQVLNRITIQPAR
ncbi:MAG: GDSL-type esterase/lipase family protein [Planctomycetaceae bacterium]